jgi:hypothetical protein
MLLVRPDCGDVDQSPCDSMGFNFELAFLPNTANRGAIAFRQGLAGFAWISTDLD